MWLCVALCLTGGAFRLSELVRMNTATALARLGFFAFYARQLEAHPHHLVPARISRVDHARVTALTAGEPLVAHVPRRHREPALVVGDWVLLDEDRVAARLDRRGTLMRAAAGTTTERQVIAANIDRVFVVMGLDGDFNLRRLERYVALCADAEVEVVVLLTKAAACPDPTQRVEACRQVATYVGVVAIAAVDVLDGVAPDLPAECVDEGMTVALLGSSGAGKSTLVNHLLGGERMAIGAVREGDDKGRHTTTHRELVALPGGGLLVDNPGMRELALWLDGDGLGRVFSDVEALAAQCHFGDCRHDGEPGCAIELAIDEGQLGWDRFESYRRLHQEAVAQARRRDCQKKREHERSLSKHYRSVQRASRRLKGE